MAIVCKKCGKANEDGAKFCSGCGTPFDSEYGGGVHVPKGLLEKDNKTKPKKKKGKGCLVGILVFFALFIIIGVFGSSDTENSSAPSGSASVQSESKAEVTYTPVTVKEMMEVLDANPLNASDKYKGQYLEVTGKLSVIDSDGKYISLTSDDPFAITGVACDLKNDEQREVVKSLSMGQSVTVRGKCTTVGEVLGYRIDVDNFITQ